MTITDADGIFGRTYSWISLGLNYELNDKVRHKLITALNNKMRRKLNYELNDKVEHKDHGTWNREEESRNKNTKGIGKGITELM